MITRADQSSPLIGHLVGASNSPRMRPPFQPASARGLSRHEVSLTADIGVSFSGHSACSLNYLLRLRPEPFPIPASSGAVRQNIRHQLADFPECHSEVRHSLLLWLDRTTGVSRDVGSVTQERGYLSRAHG
jgi:hypothetical protein